jgi:hypothetical protein
MDLASLSRISRGLARQPNGRTGNGMKMVLDGTKAASTSTVSNHIYNTNICYLTRRFQANLNTTYTDTHQFTAIPREKDITRTRIADSALHPTVQRAIVVLVAVRRIAAALNPRNTESQNRRSVSQIEVEIIGIPILLQASLTRGRSRTRLQIPPIRCPYPPIRRTT